MSTMEAKDAGNNFMNWFWDLASDATERRTLACKLIVKHVIEAQKHCNGLSTDAEYAVKRLVRGISSSRESARLGFATCLCQLLLLFPEIDNFEVTQLLDSSTQVTGSMRGAEERDLMFGRLFGYLALIKSGRCSSTILNNGTTLATHTATRLLELSHRKIWIREVVIDALLLLLDTHPSPPDLLSQLTPLLPSALEEYLPHHLQLLLGLQEYATKSATSISGLPHVAISANSLVVLHECLVAACADFPKIHAVWRSLIGSMCGVSRHLTTRAASLTAKQVTVLESFMTFLTEKCLHTTSFEKRSVALHVIVLLLQVIPAELTHIVLSKPVVRNLVVTRQNKKHTLHELTGNILSAVTSAAKGCDALKLAIASLLVQHGGADFDKITSTTTVSHLLANMKSNLVMEHVAMLCKGLAVVDDEGVSSAAANISAMYSITKNLQLQQRGDIIVVVLFVLLRLACFQSGAVSSPVVTDAKSSKKTPKKSKKADKTEKSAFSDISISSELLSQAWDVLKTIDTVTISAELQTAAAGRLLALLTDAGNMSVDSLNGASASNATTILHVALAMAKHCVSSGLAFVVESNNDDDDEESSADLSQALTTTSDLVSLLNTTEHKLAVPARVLVLQTVFHALCSDDVSASIVVGLCDCITNLLATSAASSDDDEEAPELILFELSMELLALSEKGFSIKGLRDAVKKLWSAYFSTASADDELVEAMMQAVVGEDSFEDEKEEENNNDEDEEEMSEGEEQEPAAIAPTVAPNTKDVHDMEMEESDEEIIAMDDLLEMMSDDANASDADDDATEAALANMLSMRKASRKAGLKEAKRMEYVIRSRAIDIFETFLQRCTDGQLLFPLFVPLLTCLKKVSSSKLVQELPEGRTYEQRLRSVIEAKLSKIKLHLTLEEEDDNALEIVKDTLEQLVACIKATSAPMRQTANAALICVTRCLLASGNATAISSLTTTYTDLATEVFSKKNSRVTVKPVEELFSRHVDYAVTVLLSVLSHAIAAAPSEFLRAEACRLLSIATKHYKSLSDSAQQMLVSQAQSIVDAVTVALSSTELRAKRVKPLLTCLIDVIQLLISTSTPVNTSALSACITTYINSEEAKSDAVKKQCQQVLDILAKLPQKEQTKTIKKKKEKKVTEEPMEVVEVAKNNSKSKKSKK